MAPAPAQAAECAPFPAGAGAQTPNSDKHMRLDCAGLLCGQVHVRKACARTCKQPLATAGSDCASGRCHYKQALLGRGQCALASDASRTAFEAYLQACDFTAESNAFMHAELADLLHTMRAENCSVAHTRQCPPHVRALLARVPVLAQALYVLCEQASTRHVFDLFVKSVLEHMVLIEDVISSGGTVPNARAQHCARYVEDWTQAVALVGSRCAHCFLK